MQGTGTQSDPFRPTNWDEFVTAIGTTNAYVECPENGVWDMNEMLPEGLRDTITWKVNTVHGNGLTINKLHFNGGYFNFNSTSDNDIYKLNFFDMATSGSSDKMFARSYVNASTYFRNCKLAGSISSGVVFDTPNIRLTHDGEKSCSLNFKFTGSGNLCGNSNIPKFVYCNIKYDGDTTANAGSSATAYEKCFISGKSPFDELKIYGYDNILDIEIPEGKQIVTTSYNNSHINTSVLNIDKMHGSYTSSSYKYIEVTEAQLSDAAYLQSKGFSIAG